MQLQPLHCIIHKAALRLLYGGCCKPWQENHREGRLILELNFIFFGNKYSTFGKGYRLAVISDGEQMLKYWLTVTWTVIFMEGRPAKQHSIIRWTWWTRDKARCGYWRYMYVAQVKCSFCSALFSNNLIPMTLFLGSSLFLVDRWFCTRCRRFSD